MSEFERGRRYEREAAERARADAAYYSAPGPHRSQLVFWYFPLVAFILFALEGPLLPVLHLPGLAKLPVSVVVMGFVGFTYHRSRVVRYAMCSIVSVLFGVAVYRVLTDGGSNAGALSPILYSQLALAGALFFHRLIHLDDGPPRDITNTPRFVMVAICSGVLLAYTAYDTL